jgi:UDP-3-O-[3-hydroxymyristoyl] glucosamine N-acyltransferase
MPSQSLTVGAIAEILNGSVEGNSELPIIGVAPLDQAKSGTISFFANVKYELQLYISEASAVLVEKNFEPKKTFSSALIRVENPYVALSIMLGFFERSPAKDKVGIDTLVEIKEGAKYGSGAYIGAFSYVGKDCQIGNNVKIFPNCYIGDNTIIGDDTILYAGVKLYERTVIGTHCTIHAGAVIGSHGFGFAPDSKGQYQKIPQIGNVVIGNHVDIGANTTIDCATMGSTLIEDGVKIDNLVQIAHNVKIGKNTVIAAQTGISGSTSVGKNVLIGGQVGTVGHIHIADGTIVGARSGVTKSTKGNEKLFGVPAINKGNYMKSYAIYKKLPEVINRVELLEQKLLTLESSLDPNEALPTNN